MPKAPEGLRTVSTFKADHLEIGGEFHLFGRRSAPSCEGNFTSFTKVILKFTPVNWLSLIANELLSSSDSLVSR